LYYIRIVYYYVISQQLIQGCLANDRRSQRELYELLYPILIRVGKRYTHNEEDAIEIVTNSYMKVIKNLQDVNDKMIVEAWVRRIGINTAIDYYRSKKKYRENIKLNAEYSYNAIENLHVDFNSVDKDLDAQHIYKFLQELPPITKEAINLFAIDGYSHTEISDMLEISQEMSRWHVHKARKLLSEKLEQYNNESIKYKK
jgi:RNA polymerase sigma factor (sigma-70 family)